MKKILFVLLVFSLAAFGCATMETAPDQNVAPGNDIAGDEQAVKQLCLNYAEGMNARDADIILNMFVDDGSYITRINGANRIVTKKKYAQLCQGKFIHWDKIGLKAKPIIRRINVNGDTADGFMIIKYSGPGWSSAEPYDMKFEKRDGQWAITHIHDKK